MTGHVALRDWPVHGPRLWTGAGVRVHRSTVDRGRCAVAEDGRPRRRSMAAAAGLAVRGATGHGKRRRGHGHVARAEVSAVCVLAARESGRGGRAARWGGSTAAEELRRARSRDREGEGGRERHRCDPHLVAKLGQVFLSTETEETKIDDDGTSAPRLWRRRCVLWGCFGGSELRLGFVGRAAAGGCYL